MWRVAQSRTEKPVKFGTIAADLASTVLTVKTDVYDDDCASSCGTSPPCSTRARQLVAAGCKIVQIEEPAIHSAAAWGADEETLEFYVDLFNYTVEGLEAEIWVNTCWGNPGAQHCFQPTITYEASLEIFLERVNADVWTIESKHNGHQLLPRFGPYKGKLDKKIAVGMIGHRALRSRRWTRSRPTFVWRSSTSIPSIVLSSDCGFGRQGVPRPIAFYKAAALAQGANIVRAELGVPTTAVRAADPALQIDVTTPAPAEVVS